MEERILESYLSVGLLELNGHDAWFDHITTAADQLAGYIAANPAELASFVYSAIDPSDRQNDTAREKASETLKSVWRTYASVSMGAPETIFKGIILDAVFQNAERDPQIKLAVALLFSSTLPYIELGSEAKVLQPIFDRLIEDIEEIAEAQWSVPEKVQLPKTPELDSPALTASLSKVNFNSENLQTAITNAAANNSPNHQYLSREFAKEAAEAIIDALQETTGPRRVSLKTDNLIEIIGGLVESYMTEVAKKLSTASHGVELRSRLLWWKEAKVSPSARIEYSSLPPAIASTLMALDFQKMLPILAPVSVIAFLRESVRVVASDEQHISLIEYLEEISKAKELKFYQSNQILKTNGGIHPFADLITIGTFSNENIQQLTLLNPEKKLSPSEFSTLLFTELQARKAVMNVEAVEPIDEENFNTEEQQNQDPTEIEA